MSIAPAPGPLHLLLALSLAGSAPMLAAQQPDAATGRPDSARMEAMRRAAMERSMPGPPHALLARLAGTWEQTTTYPAGRGNPPVVVRGVVRARMILDGRFLALESEGTAPQLSTKGLTILGFDRRTGTYTLVGFDTFGTYYVTAAGGFDAESRTLRMPGEDREPSGSVKRYDMIFQLTSDDAFSSRIVFRQPDGSSFTVLESVHRRLSRGEAPGDGAGRDGPTRR